MIACAGRPLSAGTVKNAKRLQPRDHLSMCHKKKKSLNATYTVAFGSHGGVLGAFCKIGPFRRLHTYMHTNKTKPKTKSSERYKILAVVREKMYVALLDRNNKAADLLIRLHTKPKTSKTDKKVGTENSAPRSVSSHLNVTRSLR